MGVLGKLIVAKGFKKLPKLQKKSPNLVTLVACGKTFKEETELKTSFLRREREDVLM